MTKIKNLVDNVCEELEGAKHYAECYIEAKVDGDTGWANRFKEMAQDELKHASYIHELVVAEINALRETITPPQEMLDKWEKSHAEYVEKAAWIKQMLTL